MVSHCVALFVEYDGTKVVAVFVTFAVPSAGLMMHICGSFVTREGGSGKVQSAQSQPSDKISFCRNSTDVVLTVPNLLIQEGNVIRLEDEGCVTAVHARKVSDLRGPREIRVLLSNCCQLDITSGHL